MQITRNRALVLTSYERIDLVPSTGKIPLYSALVQKMPFIQVNLQPPLSAKSLRKRPLRVICDEVGSFDDPVSRQVWTIGKGCKLE